MGLGNGKSTGLTGRRALPGPMAIFIAASIILHIIVLFSIGVISQRNAAYEDMPYTVQLTELPRPENPAISGGSTGPAPSRAMIGSTPLPQSAPEAAHRKPIAPSLPGVEPPGVVPHPDGVPQPEDVHAGAKVVNEANEEAGGGGGGGTPEEGGPAGPGPGPVASLEAASGPTRGGPSKAAPRIPLGMAFDREAIKSAARRDLGSPVRTDDGQGRITFDTNVYRYADYMRKLKGRIESAWVYPREAARRGIEGDLLITFRIMRDGSLGEARIDRTSGHMDLDEAALKALKDAEPYWPLPEWWEEDSITIPGHFIYTIFGTSLR